MKKVLQDGWNFLGNAIDTFGSAPQDPSAGYAHQKLAGGPAFSKKAAVPGKEAINIGKRVVQELPDMARGVKKFFGWVDDAPKVLAGGGDDATRALAGGGAEVFDDIDGVVRNTVRFGNKQRLGSNPSNPMPGITRAKEFAQDPFISMDPSVNKSWPLFDGLHEAPRVNARSEVFNRITPDGALPRPQVSQSAAPPVSASPAPPTAPVRTPVKSEPLPDFVTADNYDDAGRLLGGSDGLMRAAGAPEKITLEQLAELKARDREMYSGLLTPTDDLDNFAGLGDDLVGDALRASKPRNPPTPAAPTPTPPTPAAPPTPFGTSQPKPSAPPTPTASVTSSTPTHTPEQIQALIRANSGNLTNEVNNLTRLRTKLGETLRNNGNNADDPAVVKLLQDITAREANVNSIKSEIKRLNDVIKPPTPPTPPTPATPATPPTTGAPGGAGSTPPVPATGTTPTPTSSTGGVSLPPQKPPTPPAKLTPWQATKKYVLTPLGIAGTGSAIGLAGLESVRGYNDYRDSLTKAIPTRAYELFSDNPDTAVRQYSGSSAHTQNRSSMLSRYATHDLNYFLEAHKDAYKEGRLDPTSAALYKEAERASIDAYLRAAKQHMKQHDYMYGSKEKLEQAVNDYLIHDSATIKSLIKNSNLPEIYGVDGLGSPNANLLNRYNSYLALYSHNERKKADAMRDGRLYEPDPMYAKDREVLFKVMPEIIRQHQMEKTYKEALQDELSKVEGLPFSFFKPLESWTAPSDNVNQEAYRISRMPQLSHMFRFSLAGLATEDELQTLVNLKNAAEAGDTDADKALEEGMFEMHSRFAELRQKLAASNPKLFDERSPTRTMAADRIINKDPEAASYYFSELPMDEGDDREVLMQGAIKFYENAQALNKKMAVPHPGIPTPEFNAYLKYSPLVAQQIAINQMLQANQQPAGGQ